MLWVGLGNPGKKYSGTRHNAGAEILMLLNKGPYREERKYKALVAELYLNETRHYFLLPLTFMNLSGEAVAPFVRAHNIPIEEIVVLHDEIDLPEGGVRFKSGGGHRGHNGLRSIISHLQTGAFKRIRIGVGRPEGDASVADYVLSRPKSGYQWPIDDVKKTIIENKLPQVW